MDCINKPPKYGNSSSHNHSSETATISTYEKAQAKYLALCQETGPLFEFGTPLTPSEEKIAHEIILKMFGPNPPQEKNVITCAEDLKLILEYRIGVIRGMEAVGYGSVAYDHESDLLKMDSNYWTPFPQNLVRDSSGKTVITNSEIEKAGEGRGAIFTVADGANIHDAIKDIFVDTVNIRYFLECNTSMQMTQLYALSNANVNLAHLTGGQIVVGPEWLKLQVGSELKESTICGLMEERIIASTDELIPGDAVYFQNRTDYPQNTVGFAFTGEHAIYMGCNQFQGFGVEKGSEEFYLQTLNQEYTHAQHRLPHPEHQAKKVGTQADSHGHSKKTLTGELPGLQCKVRSIPFWNYSSFT